VGLRPVGYVGRNRSGPGRGWLSADFNCTVEDPEYVNEFWIVCVMKKPRIYGMILYVEQPFAYELREASHGCSQRFSPQPLFPGRERATMAHNKVGTPIRVVRGGAKNMQNTNRGGAERLLGARSWDGIDGAGP